MKVYLGNEGSPKRHEWMKKHKVGNMLVSNSFRPNWKADGYALDNGAFHCYLNDKPFNHDLFIKSYNRVMNHTEKPDFIVLPDIVKGGIKSYDLSVSYLHNLSYHSRWYFAVQDGMPFDILRYKISFNGSPLHYFIDGVFIGGSEKWKLRTGSKWVNEAHKLGLKCHAGRCGTFKKMLWAKHINMDSIDSATINRNNEYDRILEINNYEKLIVNQ